MKTYKGQTAGGLLKAARIEQMQAGNHEIVVTARDGLTYQVWPWGEDGISLQRVDGCQATLTLSPRASRTYDALVARVNRLTEADIGQYT